MILYVKSGQGHEIMMDIKQFDILFTNLSAVSALKFEIWEKDNLIYSSWREKSHPPKSDDISIFSSLVMDKQSFQVVRSGEGQILCGVPLRTDHQVIGALIASEDVAIQMPPSQCASEAGLAKIEQLITCLAGIMEEKWNSQRESEEMAEELCRHMGDLNLYSKISTQVKSLDFPGDMLKELSDELLDTMRTDIVFSLFSDRQDYDYIASTKHPSLKKVNLSTFIKQLINHIPAKANSLREGYFIINDSRLNPEYQKLHPDRFRFLAVPVKANQKFFGWFGLLAFNMKEIFRQGELHLLKSLAKSTAVSLENTRLFKESNLTAKKERIIRGIFQKYIPAEIVNEILDRGEHDLRQLGVGEKRHVTLLNADIRGYSKISKTLEAENIVTILNHFFMIMGNVIISHKGIVDKYLGDGILAIFGAPILTKNHALDATLAAIDMIKQCKVVDDFVKKKFGIPIKMGISIHTGEVILGNIGFDRKMEYTVIGDVVNDLFSLQDLTREKPNSILISESTQEAISPHIRTRKLGLRTLQTDENLMTVYEVIGSNDSDPL
jgi:class 3 adenylate cyclase